ncbi:MAG: helix-turn-helix transcriptional regulator [Clostridia bacterium]|nr:helix-turn-helix transcriptional regulator [Clostridia bacterium]
MLCALLISGDDITIQQFQSVSLDFDCVLKVAENEEEFYEFPADTPFAAVFLDSDSIQGELLYQIYEGVTRRFIKSEIYLFSKEQLKNNTVLSINNLKYIYGDSDIANVFGNLFPQYVNKSAKILSAIRSCSVGDTEGLYDGRRLIAVYPNTSEKVDTKIVSAFPIELLPERIDLFSDGHAVYALTDTTVNNLNRICYHIIIELHNLNISAFAIFTDVISDFRAACQLFADVNSYAVKLRFENSNNDVCYFNNEMQLLEPFGNIIKKAQATGFKIKTGRTEAKIEAQIEGFFNQPQLSGVSIVNVQFLVCEILRSAFDDEVLYNNLFSVISSKDASELKHLLINLCTKEKIGQGDLEVTGNERIIHQICEIIESEYASELYLERVAEQIYLSPAYISRIFKKSTGMNFVKYINDVRLKKAAAMLLEADYPINEISKKVGFSDVSYFCSCFKKKYGMTTVQYRRAYVLKEIEV